MNCFTCLETIRKKKKQHSFNCIDYIGRIAEFSNALVSGTSHFDGVGSNPTPLMLYCYKLTVLLACNQFENNKQHTFNCIDYIGAWLTGLNPTPLMLHSYKLKVLTAKKQFENNKQHSFSCIDYIGIIAEWSKALVSSSSHFDGVALNPTPLILHCYKLTILLAYNQFENNKQHPFNCIHYIGRMPDWSKSHSSHATLLKIKSFNYQKIIRR